VASLLGLLCGIGAIVGIILGFVAKGQIRRSNGMETGGGMATAGIIIGFFVIAIGILIVLVVVVGSSSNTSMGPLALA
jgi:hypothetical protein